MRFKVWCPACGEAAYLDERPAAYQLARNHDENYHDGASQTLVTGVKTEDTNR